MYRTAFTILTLPGNRSLTVIGYRSGKRSLTHPKFSSSCRR